MIVRVLTDSVLNNSESNNVEQTVYLPALITILDTASTMW